VKHIVKGLGFALFMGAIGGTAWWWIQLPALADARGGAAAITIDAALFSAFALHHSLLARPRAKAVVARIVPDDLVRSAYVWAASLLLLAMCAAWQPIGYTVYEVTGPGAIVLLALQASGILLSLLAVRMISVSELAGLRPTRATDVLQFTGPYRLVRHPLYLGWVLIFFPVPHMTGDRLLFAGLSTLYLLVAMPLEEAALTHHYGERYLEYRRTVRWRLIPYIH